MSRPWSRTSARPPHTAAPGAHAPLAAAGAVPGVLVPELRLTPEQAEYARTTYPADLRPMGGAWYEITFKGAYTDGYKS